MKIQFYFKAPGRTSLLRTALYVLLAGNLSGIVFIWWHNSLYYIRNPGYGNIFIGFGRLAGLLGAYAILIQLVLIGRTRWIEGIFGFDKLNRIHRLIGYSVLALLVSHPLLLIYGYSQAGGTTLLGQLAEFLAVWEDVLKAFFALLIFIFIVFFSVAIIRKKLRYETWYFVHLLTYAGIILAFGHQTESGDLAKTPAAFYYWYALNFLVIGLLLLFRFLRPIFLFGRHGFTVERVVRETPDVWSLYISGRNMKKFRFRSGQYANINILDRKMWYSHPFSFSSAYNGRYIRFSIKSLGDYTSGIKAVTPGTKVIIDGPYGVFVPERAARPKLLCIAGGIGITPIRSILETVSAKRSADITLLYACRTPQDIAFRGEFDRLSTEASGIRIHYILSTPAEGYESGYIDKEKIVKLAPDFFEREVYLCGPPPMMKMVINNLHELGIHSRNIHYEKFSF